MSGAEALRKLAEANMENAAAYFKAQIDDLSEAAAEASSTFAMASVKEMVGVSDTFVENLQQYLEDLAKRLSYDVGEAERRRLEMFLAPPLAYVRGYLDGGGLWVAIQTSFPEGDWDDSTEVKKVLHKKLAFVDAKLQDAVKAWADSYEEKAPEPAPAAAAPKQSASNAPEYATKLEALLAFADGMGVKIKKVPANPSDAWVDKLEAKLKQVAEKKKIPFVLPPWGTADLAEDDDLTQAEPAASEEELAARRERIEAMLAKAEKAELKLGRIPEEPTDAWIEQTEELLKAALEKRRAKRKAERERKAKQRKARIDRLQKSAAAVGIELGQIPPFPTEDWIARAEMRIATEMLKAHDDAGEDSGRAERLRQLLTRAAQLDMDLDVPPDPDAEWLTWAEQQLAEAETADELLFAGEAEVELDTPVLYYEEGTIQEQSWPLEGDTLSIGRTRKNDVPLPHDAQISRNHCILRREGDRWMVEDLKSTRGTLVNGKKIRQPAELSDGDAIQCGDTVLVFRAN